jgi:hypothetical protein
LKTVKALFCKGLKLSGNKPLVLGSIKETEEPNKFRGFNQDVAFLALRVSKSRFFGFSSINCQDSDPVAERKKYIFRLQQEQQGSLSSVRD